MVSLSMILAWDNDLINLINCNYVCVRASANQLYLFNTSTIFYGCHDLGIDNEITLDLKFKKDIFGSY